MIANCHISFLQLLIFDIIIQSSNFLLAQLWSHVDIFITYNAIFWVFIGKGCVVVVQLLLVFVPRSIMGFIATMRVIIENEPLIWFKGFLRAAHIPCVTLDAINYLLDLFSISLVEGSLGGSDNFCSARNAATIFHIQLIIYRWLYCCCS